MPVRECNRVDEQHASCILMLHAGFVRNKSRQLGLYFSEIDQIPQLPGKGEHTVSVHVRPTPGSLS